MNRSSRVLIILNGELGSPRDVKQAARECGTVICADGGSRHAKKLGIAPDLVLGDMDSLPSRLPRWRDTVYLCDFDPDTSDFEKALRFGVERGFREAWIAGALGGLEDHSAVNFALAEQYSAKFPIRFIGGPEARLCGPGSHNFEGKAGRRFSLLSVGEKVRVTTRGLEYALKDEWLLRGSRGLSNKAASRQVRLLIKTGRLWAIH